jgi:hypothetical protein
MSSWFQLIIRPFQQYHPSISCCPSKLITKSFRIVSIFLTLFILIITMFLVYDISNSMNCRLITQIKKRIICYELGMKTGKIKSWIVIIWTIAIITISQKKKEKLTMQKDWKCFRVSSIVKSSIFRIWTRFVRLILNMINLWNALQQHLFWQSLITSFES